MKTALASFARAMPGPVLLVNRSGVLDAVNDEARQRFGLSKAVALRLSLTEVCDLDPEAADALVRQALTTSEPMPCRLSFRNAEGVRVSYRAETWRVGNMQNAWAAFRVLVDRHRHEQFAELARTIDNLNREIHYRKTVEAALRGSEARFRQIADALPIGIVMSRIADGEILFANPAFEDLYRLPRGTGVGRKAQDFYPPGGRRADVMRIFKENDGHIDGLVLRYQRPDGTLVWMQVTGRLIEFHGDEVALSSIVDVTERKKFEEIERENQRIMMRSSRMEALGSLAGGIAHDFNNLLQPIVLQAHLGLYELPQDHPTREKLNNILASADRASALIRKILAFGRTDKQPEVDQPHDIHDAVVEGIDLVRQILPVTMRIEADLDPRTGKCALSPNDVGQITMNLAVNAHQAMAGRGVLRIALGRERVEEERASYDMTIKPGCYARLSAADQGPGIPPEIRERLFEPFFTTKKIGEGSGLGLPVIHGLVKQSGGAIFVDSGPGKGARFDIYFPLVEGEA